MPILAPEPDLYPDGLFESYAELGSSCRWWAMYTLARREKHLARRLRAMQIGHYSPQVVRRTCSPAGRTRESRVPLFTGYVFVCGDDAQRQQALTTNCVSRCLEVGDGARLARDLEQIRKLISSGAPVTAETRLTPGRRVRVRSGPMLGLEGTLTKRHGKDWLVVAVEFMQQGASVLLEEFQVEAL